VIGLFEQGIFKDVIPSAPIPASLEELCGILEMPVPSIPKTICLSDNQAISWQPAWYQAALSTQSAHANLMGTNPFDAFTTPGNNNKKSTAAVMKTRLILVLFSGIICHRPLSIVHSASHMCM
jgi:hypothetical protein